jgi:putative oxidoreductase
MSLKNLPDSSRPHLLSLLRIVMAFLFMAHGTAKLFQYPAEMGPVELVSLHGLAAVLEAFGGCLLLLGLFTRPVAFILSGMMAVAYFMAHAPGGFFPLVNHGELAVLYCFAFLYVAAAGGGPWSLDAWLRQKRAYAPVEQSRG